MYSICRTKKTHVCYIKASVLWRFDSTTKIMERTLRKSVVNEIAFLASLGRKLYVEQQTKFRCQGTQN